MERISKLLIGTSGISAIEVVNQIPLTDVKDGSNIVSLFVQIIIGIVTLVKLLKKKPIQ